MTDKNALRKLAMEKRDQIPENERIAKSAAIIETLIKRDAFLRADVVFTYINMRSEVITRPFIEYCLKEGKLVAVPVTSGGVMHFVRIDGLTDLTLSKFKVYEPALSEERIMTPDDKSLIVVPGVAFDVNKNRLGYGKGFYDRFLRSSAAKNIAVCFEEQIEPHVPTTKFDTPVQLVITDRRSF